MPYSAALLAWLLAGFVACYAALRRLLPGRWAILPIAASPGILVNAGHGQNGFVTAACYAWCMVLARARPFLAGLPLGLLAVKPHLLLLAPLLLLAGGRWRMLAGAALSGGILCGASWLILGQAAWQGFLQNAPLARATLEQGLVPAWKMQSVFAGVRLLHGGIGLAFALQAAVAAIVILQCVRVVRHRPGADAEIALLVVATLLCTPFLLDYDLMVLAAPIAWVTAAALREGWREGWHDWEKLVLLAAYTLPLFARPVALLTGLPLAPPVLAALMLIVSRRAARTQPASWHNIHYTTFG